MKMLLKYSAAQKKIRSNNNGKLGRASAGAMRVGTMTALQRHRKVLNRNRIVVKRELVRPLDPCENSNDSGLGFDHHASIESQPLSSLTPFSFAQSSQKTSWREETPDLKRRRPDVKVESDNANAEFTFAQNPPLCTERYPPAPRPGRRLYGKRLSNITQNSPISSSVRDPKVYLQILCQPEQQHRARYQTEGSRGAVKDRTGNGFPVVKLVGFAGPATLEVFIGTDQGKIAPHMFYQACKVAGKNSTPCLEKKTDGTVIIDIDFDPSKDMAVTCDCVGILKERNVDVEQRFPEESTARSKKKSTRCRMVFRTTLTNPVTGESEVLQVASQPIVCTQPPGTPEIAKKSLTSCSVTGGAEIFILGKNFLKDTQVVFQRVLGDMVLWEQSVIPDKEFLQQSHLVCKVPPYEQLDIKEPLSVIIRVVSSGRHSEPQTLIYTPDTSQMWPGLTIKNEHLPPSRLMPPPLIPMYSKQIDTPLPLPLPLSSTQKLDAIVNSAADSHIQPLQLLSTQAATEPGSEQQLLHNIINKSVAESSPNMMQSIITTEAAAPTTSDQLLALQYTQPSTGQQQQLLEQIIQKTEMQLQLQEANAMISETSPQQLMQNMNETSPQHLIGNMTESTSQQFMQSINESSTQQLVQSIQTMNETSTHLIEKINESSQQLIQSITESTTQQIIEKINENTQEIIEKINESSTQQLIQSISDSTINESTTHQLIQSINEPSTQQLIQSMSEASSLISDPCSELSPPQIVDTSSTQQIIKSINESTTQQIIEKMNENSQHLIEKINETSQQLIQTINETSSQQLIQTINETISEPSTQQLIQSMSDSYSASSSLMSDQCSDSSLSPPLPYSQAMDDSNSQDPTSLSQDEPMLLGMIQKHEDLMETGATQDMMLLSMNPMPKPPQEAVPCSQLNLSTSSPASQQMLDIIVSTVPSEEMKLSFSRATSQVPVPFSQAPSQVPVSQPTTSQQILQLLVKTEEPKDIPSEITQMSTTDLLSFINPDCFNNV